MGWTQIANLRGPTGPPGGSVFEHDQTSPANPWIINHGLNRFPHVSIIVDGVVVEADVAYGGPNTVTISFAEPTSGKAVLS